MNFKRFGAPVALVAAAALALTGCAANEAGGGATDEAATGLSGTLVGGGASSQQAAQEAWVASFQTANPDVTIEYDPAGSGAGRDTFIAGGSNFAGSDRAFKDDEIAGEFASCVADTGIIEIPAYISPIAIIFNLEGVDSLNLDAATVAGIFSGKIITWNDPAIASANPDATLPATPITPVHRADDSGTTENFTDYLHAAAPEAWVDEADGVWPLEGGEAAQGTSGVVDTVTGGTGTIGYADASRAGELGTVSIKVGDEYVEYSAEAAAAIVDASPFAEGRTDGDLAIELDRTSSEAGVYPIVLVSYLIGCSEYQDAEVGPLVKAYFSSIISEDGQAISAEAAGTAPISSELFDKASAAVELIK